MSIWDLIGNIQVGLGRPVIDLTGLKGFFDILLELWGRHLWPLHSWKMEGSTLATMTLLNFGGDKVSLLCGDAHVSTPLGMDADEHRQLRITQNKIRDGELLDTCTVRFKKQGTADIDITFYETPPYHRSGPASRRIPGIPFPRF